MKNDGFQFRTAAIAEKITEKTRAIFINSPSNPTGNLLSPDRMRKIADLSPYVISDEIYHAWSMEKRNIPSLNSPIARLCSTDSPSFMP